MTEQEYRAIDKPSSSSLKDFATDRFKFRKKYVLKEKNRKDDDPDSSAVVMGKLVETKLFEKELLEEKFIISTIDKRPTGKVLLFTNELFKLTMENLDENGECTMSFEDRAIKAREVAEYAESTTLDKVIAAFKKTGEDYFDYLLANVGKNVVTTIELEISERIKHQLETAFPSFTRPNSDRFLALNQLKITEGLVIDGVDIKGMLDRVEIDLDANTLQIMDLKVTYNPEQFFWSYYLERKSYLQAYIYSKCIMSPQFLKLIKGFVPKGTKLKVLPFKFIVADSTSRLKPLSYEFDNQAMEDAYNGFKVGNKPYTGLKEILEEYDWVMKNNIWDISYKNFKNESLIKLSECYGE